VKGIIGCLNTPLVIVICRLVELDILYIEGAENEEKDTAMGSILRPES
jgi:hypothetical protein